jgi:LysR family glycine cleavage system transcriptional activator
MRRKLPSIMALQAFEASARLQSFTDAGRECCLTSGAISRQVRILEVELGSILFQRQPGRLVLSRAGECYLEEIREALIAIEQAGLRIARLDREEAFQLSIATLPGFGARWLMPRYPDFAEQQPDIAIRFYTRTEPADFNKHGCDAAIYCGTTPPAGMQSDWLTSEEQVAVCSPSMRPPHGMATDEALKRFKLFPHVDRPAAWDEWLVELGLSAAGLRQGPVFEQMQLMIGAAMSGLGMALVPRFMVHHELAAELLIEPFAQRVSSRCDYWLIYPTSTERLPSLKIFRAWLLGQARGGVGMAALGREAAPVHVQE